MADRERTLDVNITLKTFGREHQAEQTVANLEDVLKVHGFKVLDVHWEEA